MSTGESALAKTIDSLLRLGAFTGADRHITLHEEIDSEGDWAERTVAVISDRGIGISYQHKKPADSDWVSWQDSGASLSWDEVKALANGLDECFTSIDESG